jgi:tRNA A37 threonylcarbamoyladenosine dehydratase
LLLSIVPRQYNKSTINIWEKDKMQKKLTIGTTRLVSANARYMRNSSLIKQSNLDELTIVGAGGVGSALVMNAAIMGFKCIHIWDFDMLEQHNLSTTTYPEEYLHLPKVEAAEKQAILYNKTVKIYPHNEKWVRGKYLSQ